jgi:hypothetical protein
MAPAPEQTGAFRVQKHDERLRERVDLDAVAGLPFRGGRRTRAVRRLHDPAETGISPVDDPRAVTRLDDDFFHVGSIPRPQRNADTFSFRFRDSCYGPHRGRGVSARVALASTGRNMCCSCKDRPGRIGGGPSWPPRRHDWDEDVHGRAYSDLGRHPKAPANEPGLGHAR